MIVVLCHQRDVKSLRIVTDDLFVIIHGDELRDVDPLRDLAEAREVVENHRRAGWYALAELP